RLAPQSEDVRLYLALHYAKGAEWPRAVPVLEQIVQASPDRLPAIEALASLRERQGRPADALALFQRVYRQRQPSLAAPTHLGGLAMSAGDTTAAIDAFEAARARDAGAF